MSFVKKKEKKSFFSELFISSIKKKKNLVCIPNPFLYPDDLFILLGWRENTGYIGL